MILRIFLASLVMTSGLLGGFIPAKAAVPSSPTFELDGSNPLSLATSGATSWRDLVSSGSITGSLVGGAAYSSVGGGSLLLTAAGPGAASFPIAAAGTPTNPSNAMTVMMWVRFTSFNEAYKWNLLASRFFTGNGSDASPDWHFSVTKEGSSRVLNYLAPNSVQSFGTTAISLNTWYQLGFTLTGTGVLQFYVNGTPDGSTITGATRNSSASARLWIGDNRTEYNALGMNGNVARFRMWNSVLSSATVSNDFDAERENFGFPPVVTSASFTLASNTPVTGRTETITATVPSGSKVTFYENTKRIPGCISVPAISTTALCRWKPRTRGVINLRVSYMTSGSSTVNWSPSKSITGSRRTGFR